MGNDILSIDDLLLEQQNEVSKSDESVEQEAANIAGAMAKKIFSILKNEFIQSSLNAKKDKQTQIITGVTTDIVMNENHNNEGCAKSLIKSLTEALTSEGYEVIISSKIESILLYKSVPVEVSIPDSKLAALGINKKIKRISPSELYEGDKVVHLHSVKRIESSEPISQVA